MIIAFVIPAAIFILSLIDFTEKQGWTEQREEHAIPVKLEKGELIDITMDFNNVNQGGHGFHVKNEDNN